MKEKIKLILVSILIGFVAFPVFTLGGTFVVSLIQGKSVEEAVQILAEQIDALIGRVEILETKQTEQQKVLQEMQNIVEQQKKKILCQELIKQTPQEGDITYRNIDIVKFYRQHQDIVAKKEQYIAYLKTLPTFNDPKSGDICVRDPKADNVVKCLKDEEADLNFFKKVLSEAQVFYDKYMATCGDLIESNP
jgi:uncharacterized protein YneF (UPF0154 family)